MRAGAHNENVLAPTSVTASLGISQPVLQAPMAGAATPELAAAVSAAGGLGALGSAVLDPDELRAQAAAVRAATDAPFNVNFFCHSAPEVGEAEASAARERIAPLYADRGLGEPPEAEVPPIAFDEPRLEALLEIRPAVASFVFGLPEPAAVEALRDAEIRVIAAATTVAEAVRLRDLGADAVIAQGAEAGGHRSSFLVDGDDGPIGTLALVPQVVDAVGDLPVIAAGGIADGRGLAAALALGAGAAQVGSAFLACPESAIDPAHRRAALERRRRANHDHAGVLRAAGAGGPQPGHRGVRGRRGAALPGAAVADDPARRIRGRSRGRAGDVARPGRLAGARAPGRGAGRVAGGRGRAGARRAQPSRLICEPPTIASEPSPKRTQALLPPS